MTEKEIIDGCRCWDSDAQRELYDRLSPAMFALCLRYAGERSVAEDLLHDGFITVFTKIGDYRGDGSFEGWCRRIFVNTALGHLRRNNPVAGAQDIEQAHWLSTQESDALDRLSGQETAALIAALPEGYRTVLNLYAVEGYSHKEIGEMLGVSENTSRSQYARARARLMEEITQRERDGDGYPARGTG